MTSIVVDPSSLCILLVCGAGESNVTFTAQEIYSRWSDWLLLSDNLKYLPAFDSSGGASAGAGTTDIVYTFLVANGWSICPQTTEPSVRVVITGDLYPDVDGSPMFGYDEVASGGHTHIEQRVTTSARVVTTGGSIPTAAQNAAAVLAAAQATPIHADIKAVNGYSVAGAGTPGNPWGPA
jgi:hypothetical protein